MLAEQNLAPVHLKTTHHQRSPTICALVATANQDDQHLITQCLCESHQVKLLYSSSAEETIACLDQQAVEYHSFPNLLLLDLEIAPRATAWSLLKQIRTSYQLLPIVLISKYQDRATIQQAYELGAHAFMNKSANWNTWREALEMLAYYWLRVVSLPKLPIS